MNHPDSVKLWTILRYIWMNSQIHVNYFIPLHLIVLSWKEYDHFHLWYVPVNPLAFHGSLWTYFRYLPGVSPKCLQGIQTWKRGIGCWSVPLLLRVFLSNLQSASSLACSSTHSSLDPPQLSLDLLQYEHAELLEWVRPLAIYSGGPKVYDSSVALVTPDLHNGIGAWNPLP